MSNQKRWNENTKSWIDPDPSTNNPVPDEPLLDVTGREDYTQLGTDENGVRHEFGIAKAQYPANVDPAIATSPHYAEVHSRVAAIISQQPLSIAGGTALSKDTATKLREGDAEKGHAPLNEMEIAERVQELAAHMFAQQALARSEFMMLPNAEGDEVTVAFTAVVLHPADFGQLMTELESVCIRYVEEQLGTKETKQ
ncbi:MAG TPA: hypothetical protein VJ840_18690 [Gemmatimonadaceae bacterium]|nr:hypothetical protein [Gemmatimonadaceae bacterium]